MNELTTIQALLKRLRRKPKLAACAMAALLFLTALSAPARAQNTYGGSTVIRQGTIGLVPGQSLIVTVPNLMDGSVRFVKHSIKVYEIEPNGVTENESGLIYSGESGGLNESGHEYGHIFTINYSDLAVRGELRTGRVQLSIVTESYLLSTTHIQTEDRPADVSLPTFEVIDLNGRTVLFGMLLPAQAQEVRFFNAFGGFQGGVSVGAAAGQTIRILVEAADAAPPSLNKPSGDPDLILAAGQGGGGHVKVFNLSTGALIWSRELPRLAAGLHTIDINREELPRVGNSDNDRLQVYIEVVLVECQAGSGRVFSSSFEVFDNVDGRTTVRGTFAKVGTGHLILPVNSAN